MEQAHSGLALVQLGLALHLMGDEARGKAAIDAGLKKPRSNDAYWWGDYGSALRDGALSYVLLDKHNLKPEGRENLVSQVAAEVEKRRYFSTQEKLALFLLGRSFATQQTGEWTAEMSSGGKGEIKPARLGGKGTQYLPLGASELAGGVKLTNTHKERLFVELNYAGNPAKAPAARRETFDITRRWYTADGQPLGNRALRVGESLLVQVSVKTRGSVVSGLVVDYVPAGVEIENANLAQGEQNALTLGGIDMREAMQDMRIKHREFRDDRFVVAARLERENHFFYRVRVVTPGKFVVPPTYVEDMYQPMVYGLAGGGEVVTVNEGKD